MAEMPFVSGAMMKTLCILLLMVSSLFLSRTMYADQSRPNIVVVLLDDLGYSDLGCYGGEIQTPNIDSLANSGIRFESFYNSARCCPSRASLMTGLYPPQTGIASFTLKNPQVKRGPAYLGRLNNQCVTLAETLRPAGYSCYYVGKWHLHKVTNPIARGFEEFYGYSQDHSHDQWDADYYQRLPEGRKKEIDPPQGKFYATDVFNEYAIEFIKKGQEKPKPWFLFLGHSSPHFPVQAPTETVEKYYQTYLKGWDVLRKQRYERMQQIGLVDGERWSLTDRSIVPVDRPDIANGFPGKENPAWDSLSLKRKKDLARRMAIFAAMVEHVDRGVGKIVKHLKKTNQFENTMFMILSDNGSCYEWGPFGFDGISRKGINHLHTGEKLKLMGSPGTYHSYGSGWANLGNTPFRLYKHFTHEGGVCTPFIVHWPKGISGSGQWIRQPGHLVDVMPTLREVSGAKYPSQYKDEKIHPEAGVSLLPSFAGQKISQRAIYFEHQKARGIIQGEWKAVWGKRMPTEPRWELYHLKTDRCETIDVAAEHPQVLSGLISLWDQYAKKSQIEPYIPSINK